MQRRKIIHNADISEANCILFTANKKVKDIKVGQDLYPCNPAEYSREGKLKKVEK
jgi:hypothetical protein